MVTFENNAAAQVAEAIAAKQKDLSITRHDAALHFALTQAAQQTIIHEARESNISVLKSRIDQFGVGENMVAAQGDKNIVVELPDVQDIQKAKAMIGTSAMLEVKPVLDVGPTEQDILNRYGGTLPEDMMIAPGRNKGGHKEYYLVPKHAELTGKMLKTARANPTGGEFGLEPVVAFEFNAEGGDKFYEMTSRGSSPMISMILDGVVVTAATARLPLRDGYISGNFTLEEAQEIAAMLRSGAFVAPVTFEEDRTIGPSLGQESIHKGLMSCAIGLLLLFLFSVIMYKTSGLFAFIVLLYNLLLILFALAALGATLTLPGIAGMVLTIGMAIDSSILIYERIREELKAGRPFREAVNVGFSGATEVILDANITTFLVAVVLYKLGAGPIQGFAVTMIVGILATLITGLLLLKAIFNFVLDVMHVKKFSI